MLPMADDGGAAVLGVEQRGPAAVDQGGQRVPRGHQPALGRGGRVHQPAHQESGQTMLLIQDSVLFSKVSGAGFRSLVIWLQPEPSLWPGFGYSLKIRKFKCKNSFINK